MKFTKLTVLALILALFICAFVACGGPAETETEAGTETEAATNETEAGNNETEAGNNETEAGDNETEGGDKHVHDVEVVVDEATCIERGYTREVCKTCSEVISIAPIQMIDHVAKDGASCTTDTVCKFCETVMAAAAGHTYGDATVTKAATCEAEGEQAQTCTTCGEKATSAIAKLAHAVAAPTDSKAATLTAAGYTKGTCSLCNKEVTVDIPAGAVDTYDNFPIGVVTADIFAANSAMASDFTYSIEKGTLEVASEDGNTYIKKTAANDKLYYKSNGVFANATKAEFSFDLRLDADCSALRGLFSLVNGGKEMRILNVQKNSLWFGINAGGTIEFMPLEIGKWINIKVVLDITTYDYEIYIDGEKYLYTTADPDNAGMHLVYTLQEGELAIAEPANNETLHNGADRSPFVPNGTEIESFYFFHFSTDLACGIDDVTVSLPAAE